MPGPDVEAPAASVDPTLAPDPEPGPIPRPGTRTPAFVRRERADWLMNGASAAGGVVGGGGALGAGACARARDAAFCPYGGGDGLCGEADVAAGD